MVSLIYGFLSIVTVAFVFFFLPETRGRTLEEIIYMFEKKVPARKWDEFDTTKMTIGNDKRHRFSGEAEHVEDNEQKLEKKDSA